jgi:hypothetical protein
MAVSRSTIAPGSVGAPSADRSFRLGVLVLLISTISVRAWTVSRWSWYADDWDWMYDTQRLSFHDYLVQGAYNGHLQPAQFLITWLIARFDPLNWTWAVVVVTLLVAAVVGAWAMALRELFGERSFMLGGLAVIALSPVMTGVSLWWATSVNAFSLQASLGLAVWALARWLFRGQRPKDRWLLLAAYLFGLVFWQKALLVMIPLVFVVLVAADGDLRSRLRLTVRALWPLAIVSSAYFALFVWMFLHPRGASDMPPQTRTSGEAVSFFVQGVTGIALPSMVGGPFSTIAAADSVFPPAPWGLTLALVLVAGVLGTVAVRHRKRALLAITLAVVYAGVSWSLILLNVRFAHYGPDLARSNRYWSDGIVVWVLAACLLVAPTRNAPAGAWLRRPLGESARQRLKTLLSHGATAMAALCAVGTAYAWTGMAASSPKPWVDNVVHDAGRVGARSLADTYGPAYVVSYIPFNRQLSHLLATLRLPLRYDEPDENILVAAPDGHLTVGQVTGGVTNEGEGPEAGCGFPIKPDIPTEIPLTGPVFDLSWGVELSYFTGSDAVVTVQTDRDDVEVFLPAGAPGEVAHRQLIVHGAVNSLSITGRSGSDTVCITGVHIGNLAASQDVPPSQP